MRRYLILIVYPPERSYLGAPGASLFWPKHGDPRPVVEQFAEARAREGQALGFSTGREQYHVWGPVAGLGVLGEPPYPGFQEDPL